MFISTTFVPSSKHPAELYLIETSRIETNRKTQQFLAAKDGIASV